MGDLQKVKRARGMDSPLEPLERNAALSTSDFSPLKKNLRLLNYLMIS